MPLTLAKSLRSLATQSRSLRPTQQSFIHHQPSVPSSCSSTLRKPYNLQISTRAFSRTFSRMAPTDTSAIERTRAIVISGPSGTGKSTILKRLFDEFPDKFGFSISHTTRGPRAGEQHGREYYFVQKEEFLDLVDNKGFIEHAQFGDNHYGTSIKAVNDIAEKGRICILDIEMEGVKQVANHPTFPRPRFLFLSPPSMDVLEQRLRSRATDKEEAILKRLKQAKNEMDFASSGEAPHDKVVVNDDLDQAYNEVKEFIISSDA